MFTAISRKARTFKIIRTALLFVLTAILIGLELGYGLVH